MSDVEYMFLLGDKVVTVDTDTPSPVVGIRSGNGDDGRPRPFIKVAGTAWTPTAWYYPHELRVVERAP